VISAGTQGCNDFLDHFDYDSQLTGTIILKAR
jgi:hypothetical protein